MFEYSSHGTVNEALERVQKFEGDVVCDRFDCTSNTVVRVNYDSLDGNFCVTGSSVQNLVRNLGCNLVRIWHYVPSMGQGGVSCACKVLTVGVVRGPLCLLYSLFSSNNCF